MKKISLTVIASLLAFQCMAQAATVAVTENVIPDNETAMEIVINGTVDIDTKSEAGKTVILRVYKAGETNPENIEYMAETEAEPDGSYEFKYIKDGDSGSYKVEVNAAASTQAPIYTTHNYLSPKEKLEFLSKVNTTIASESDTKALDLYKVLQEYQTKNVITIDKLPTDADYAIKTEIPADITYIMNYIAKTEKYEDLPSIISNYNDGYAVYTVETAAEDKITETIEDTFIKSELMLNDKAYAEYLTVKDAVNTTLSASTFESPADIAEKLYYYTLKELLKGKVWQQVYPVLVSMQEVTLIDFTNYEALSSDTKKDKALEYFTASVSSVAKLSDFKSKFDTAVSQAVVYTESTGASTYTPVVGNSGGKKDNKVEINIAPIISTTTQKDENKVYFTDIDSVEWAKEAINYLAENKCIEGDGNGNFRPNDLVTRAEFVKMIIEGTKLEHLAGQGSAFTDVSDGAWYKPYVDRVVKAGIVNGVTDTEFMPNQPIKRADVAVISIRVMKYFGFDFTMDNIVYSDVTENYAYESIYQAANAGIMTGIGDNKFEPERGLTRAEAAKVIYEISKSKGDFIK